MLWLVLPFGALIALAAVVAGMVAGGWNFSLQPLAPRWDKLSLLQGLSRLVSLQHLGEMGKVCLLALLLVVAGGLMLHERLMAFAGLASMPLPAALVSSFDLVKGALIVVLVLLGLFAVIDVPLQRRLLLNRLRMSHEEAKKENRDIEGNIAVKAKIRARMREMANRRMFAAVPKADLVVMNPSHYAVALKYDEGTMAAPRVVAKGADLVALRIRDLAREHRVPVLQAPPLARALYTHTELDREIPAALFSAVAQVLAWVFQLRHPQADRAALWAAPPVPQVPAELDPHSAPARSADE
jgi:flagellar biosynthetic protein FlhB